MSNYFYSQNRKAFGANNQNDAGTFGGCGRLFGATRNGASNSFPRGQWNKMNWTLVLNSSNVADGIQRFWINGVAQTGMNTSGLLWQQDIANHPFNRLVWDWFWGGTPTSSAMLPITNHFEYLGDFRIAVSSRANALLNPWPFA